MSPRCGRHWLTARAGFGERAHRGAVRP
jgi:hypothetical protein